MSRYQLKKEAKDLLNGNFASIVKSSATLRIYS